MNANPFSNQLKTWTLMAALAGLLVAVGGLLGGQSGMILAFGLAVALNGFAYWKSDSLALRANGARELGPAELPQLRRVVGQLATAAGLPMPRVYLVDRPEPNAFATGRDPKHAAVAVTTGLLQIVDERQLRGVLAHELSHVRNRDTLIGSIAATFAGAISFLVQMAQFQLFFGGGDGEDRNPLGLIAAIILAPLAAVIVQLAVTRSREYLADSSGAALTGDPEGLAQALERLEASKVGLLASLRGRKAVAQTAPNPAFSHLYIVNPLTASSLGSLFSTHPSTQDRVRRLRSMAGRGAVDGFLAGRLG